MGKGIHSLPAVGDCDDVLYDQARKRIYASGGEGAISVFEQQSPDQYKELARIPTVKGARTSFFSPELGRLYLAVKHQGSQPASIQVFEPRDTAGGFQNRCHSPRHAKWQSEVSSFAPTRFEDALALYAPTKSLKRHVRLLPKSGC